MNPIEKELMNILQEGIPLVKRPFQEIGQALELTEQEVIEMIASLKARGLIRRFGGIVNISEMGISSTLVGLQVREEKLRQVAEAVSAYPGVTHNYERDDAYNLWFTLMEPSEGQLRVHIEKIRALEGVDALINLPSKNKYKTKVILKL